MFQKAKDPDQISHRKISEGLSHSEASQFHLTSGVLTLSNNAQTAVSPSLDTSAVYKMLNIQDVLINHNSAADKPFNVIKTDHHFYPSPVMNNGYPAQHLLLWSVHFLFSISISLTMKRHITINVLSQ